VNAKVAITPALEHIQFPASKHRTKCTETGNTTGFLFWDQNLMVEVQQLLLIFEDIDVNFQGGSNTTQEHLTRHLKLYTNSNRWRKCDINFVIYMFQVLN